MLSTACEFSMDFSPPPPPPRYSAENPEPVEEFSEAPEVHEVHDELFEKSLRAADKAFVEQSKGGSAWWLIISCILFVLTRLGGFNPVSTGILVGVLVLHEAGHFLGMKLFGYRDVKMFFIPFLGAAVSGRKHAAAAWQEIIVLLLGPLPGILLGTILFFTLWPTDTKSVLYRAISMLLAINAFNLLPFMPLDGGRVMNLLIFRRHPALEVLFKLFAVGGLLLLALVLMSWVLAVVGILILVGIPLGFKLGMRARKIKQEFPTISTEWNEQGVAEFHRLYSYSREVLPPDQNPLTIGKRMVTLHELAAANSPGFLATVFFLGFFTVSFFIAPVAGIGMLGHQKQIRDAAKRRTKVAEMLVEVRMHLQQATALEKQAVAEDGIDQPETLKQKAEHHRLIAKDRLDQALEIAKDVRKRELTPADEAILLEAIKLRDDNFRGAVPVPRENLPPEP